MKKWLQQGAIAIGAVLLFMVGIAYATSTYGLGTITYEKAVDTPSATSTTMIAASEVPAVAVEAAWPLVLDTGRYDALLLELARYQSPATTTITIPATATTPTTTKEVVPPSPLRYSTSSNVTVEGKLWPAAAPYPHGGAILPFSRILAYYGNFYSRQMGILGELDPPEMIAHLMQKKAEWEAADPDTPVVPAIHYIAMVAQADGGVDGMYRAVMPDEHIEKAYELAKQIDGIMILDLQVGLSTIEQELPKFREYLTRPEVHLGIDPEFSMKSGHKPGVVVGTYDAADINFVIKYLSEIVREHGLPPKVLVVHRFTQDMVTRFDAIEPTPEVQVVMHMDGWGSKQLKYGTYNHVILPEPVQFTGVKIFYKNDLKPPSTGILTPQEVLNLHPEPIYVQYQ